MSPAPNRSTGPRTAAGIENCKYNATRHGLTGAQIVVNGEDPARYDELRAALHTEHEPASEEESMLVERIAQNWWKLQRAERYERELCNTGRAFAMFSNEGFTSFQRHRNAVERAWNRARKELHALQAIRKEAAAEAQASATVTEATSAPEPDRESVLTLSPNADSDPVPAPNLHAIQPESILRL